MKFISNVLYFLMTKRNCNTETIKTQRFSMTEAEEAEYHPVLDLNTGSTNIKTGVRKLPTRRTRLTKRNTLLRAAMTLINHFEDDHIPLLLEEPTDITTVLIFEANELRAG